jgi:hypothetical protein
LSKNQAFSYLILYLFFVENIFTKN